MKKHDWGLKTRDILNTGDVVLAKTYWDDEEGSEDEGGGELSEDWQYDMEDEESESSEGSASSEYVNMEDVEEGRRDSRLSPEDEFEESKGRRKGSPTTLSRF